MKKRCAWIDDDVWELGRNNNNNRNKKTTKIPKHEIHTKSVVGV